MFRYLLRRCAYSLLIMFGVLLVTFFLFRVAAGDPAAAVLGKNPTAEELELMRERLGTSKPLFFGTSRETLRYESVDFRKNGSLPKSAMSSGKVTSTEFGLLVPSGAILKFTPRFPSELPCKAEILTANGELLQHVDSQGNVQIENNSGQEVLLKAIRFTVPTV